MDTAIDEDKKVRGRKGREAFRTISEVAGDLDLPQHVLRFWETKFSQVKPLKRGGNRRYYRPDDVEVLKTIKKLLHSDGYTIRGVQKLFRAQGVKQTIGHTLYGEELEIADETSVITNESSGPDLAASDKEVLNEILSDLKSIKAMLAKL